jgi:hypothetical protein
MERLHNDLSICTLKMKDRNVKQVMSGVSSSEKGRVDREGKGG